MLLSLLRRHLGAGPAGAYSNPYARYTERNGYPIVTSRPCAVSAQITAISIAMMTIAATGE